MKVDIKPFKVLQFLLGTTALVTGGVAVAQEQEPPAQEQEDEEAVLGPVIVRGRFIPDEKRSTSEISSVLDEASFERTGDGDIATALSRVSGISISDGKFVIVRGLNDRYSSVTINGSPLPSPEPLRRVVPLDLIPTSFLGGALVQKTFSPQFSGEFGGGLVELRTKSIPDEFYLNIGASVGADTATTGQDGLFHDGSGADFFGFDSGTRSLPDSIEAAFFGVDGIGTFDQQELDLALGVPETLITFIDDRPPAHGFSTEFGGFFDLSPRVKVGANFAANFSNDYQTRQGRREQGLVGTAINSDAQPFDEDLSNINNAANLRDFTSTTQTTTLNGLAAFGLEVGSDHQLTSTTFVLRSTSNDTRLEDGLQGEEESAELLEENFEFIENQVWQTQLSGDHVFPFLGNTELIWRAAYGEAFRDAPFQREQLRARFSPNDGFGLTFAPSFSVGSIGVNASSVSFSRIDDQNIDLGFDFTVPFSLFENSVDFKFGYAYTDKERDSLVRDFIFQATNFPDLFAVVRNDVLFSEAIAGTDVFDALLITNPISLDNAFSSLEVQAGYIGFDAEVGPYFRLAVGARWEGSDQLTQAFSTSLPDTTFSESLIRGDFLLPSATLTWNPIGDLQLRLGYSETITRPQFRELTPATFIDDQTDQLIIGNPFLRNSEIQNYDARLEYYLGRGQFVTFGGFFKDIENPIETTSDLLGGEVLQTFVNAPSAEVYGFEFEYEQTFDLGEWTTNQFLNSKELIFKTNYTFSDSSVDANGTVVGASINSAIGASPIFVDGTDFIVDGRRLQGQSKHLFNFQLGLEDPDTNGKATILLNYASERIRQTENVITGGIIPAVDEQVPILLDFVVSRDFQTFGQIYNVELAVRNIAGDDYEATQTFDDGSVADFDVFNVGTEFSGKITFKF
ncbi:MAG: TonB-dependent receptor [Pseudomonadota bacterium]